MLARYNIRFIIVLHAIANLVIGVSLLLWTNLSAENVLNKVFPSWLWPCMFIAAGIIAVFGIRSRPLAQFSYAFAGVITLVFGVASIVSGVQTSNLAAVAPTMFLLYIAIMKFELAYMIAQRDSIVQSISESTEIAKSALKDVEVHGTTTRRSD